MTAYWTVQRQPNVDWGEHVDWEVRGAAGEQVQLNTTRCCPFDEYEAIARALNALPEYAA